VRVLVGVERKTKRITRGERESEEEDNIERKR
jgi:hypothetical protein